MLVECMECVLRVRVVQIVAHCFPKCLLEISKSVGNDNDCLINVQRVNVLKKNRRFNMGRLDDNDALLLLLLHTPRTRKSTCSATSSLNDIDKNQFR